MTEKNQINMKIGLGSFVKAKVVDMKENTREVRERRRRKEVVVCVQDMVGKKNFLIQFEYSKKNIQVLACLCMYVQKMRYDLIWISQYQTFPKNNKLNC